MALEHLLSLGHTRIGLITGISQRKRKDTRYARYVEFHRAYGLKLDEQLVVRCPYSQSHGEKAAHALLSIAHPPTAILAGNDILAIGALLAAQQMGLNIPDDLSLIGIDDIYAASTTSPPLTTVAKPKYEIGTEAATRLLHHIQDDNPPAPRQIFLKGHLVIRQTTGR